MKINELTKQLGVSTNKEVIEYLKTQGYKVSSHMQTATDDMIDAATSYFKKDEENKGEEVTEPALLKKEQPVPEMIKEERPQKTFKPDDVITCRSVTPWKLNAVGVDKNTVYHWSGYGDVDYLTFRDLQSLRRTEYITKPKIIIEDADLCYQWRRELGNTYKYFLGVEYPEEFFDLPDEEFKKILLEAPDVVKEVIKVTAINMVNNKNYPTLQKLGIIDDILGTCIKEFL